MIGSIQALCQNCTIGPMPHTPEWERMRLYDPTFAQPVRIGASECAGACGVSKYEQPLSIYLQKRGEVSRDFSPDIEQRLRLGLLMEPVILTEYTQRTRSIVTPGQPTYFSIKWPWMSATPDAFATADGVSWIVECKNSSEYMQDRSGEDATMFGVDGTDQVPLDYMFQAQHQMAVTGFDRVDFAVLVGGNRLNVYTVKRDEMLIQSIVEATRQLAEQIVAGTPPEPQYSHPSVARCLKRGLEEGKTIELPPDAEKWWNDYRDAKAVEESAKARSKEAMARLLAATGDAQFATVGPLKLRRVVVAPHSYTTTVTKPGHSFMKESK